MGIPELVTASAATGGASRPTRSWRGGWVAFLISLVARQLLCVGVALVLVTVLPALVGWHSTVVMSGSMGPRIHVGDIAIARPADGYPLRLDQVVLVKDPDHPGRLRLHRFVGTTGDGHLITQGDRNRQADSSHVPRGSLVGIAVLRVPDLGLPMVWMRSGQPLDDLAVLAVLLAAIAGALVFQADEAPGSGSLTHRSEPPIPLLATRRRFMTRGAVSGGVLLVAALVIGSETTAAAAYAAQTGDSGNSFAAKGRYRCADRVLGDNPFRYYQLTEAAGTTAADSSSNARPGTYSSSGVTYGATGPCSADLTTAVTLDGGATTGVTTSDVIPRPTSFTAEMWIRTTTTTGGTLFGIFDSITGSAGQRDPIAYMNNAGQVTLRMYNPVSGAALGLTSPAALNDNAWHLVSASYTGGTAKLYVDGAIVATGAITWSNPNAGYLRIGYGSASGWSDSPTNQGFTGSVAGAAVFTSALTAAQVANHAGSRARTCADAIRADSPAIFYKLNEASGTTANDASGSGNTGTYAASGVTYGTAGPCPADGSTAVTLSGGTGVGVTQNAVVAHPTNLTTEIRFKSTTTTGGLLIGFYGSSSTYDLILYMRDDGHLAAGSWNPSTSTSVVAATGSAYNDGAWHVADFTYSGTGGTTLSVDGGSAVTAAAVASPDTYTGSWHVGYGTTTGWAGRPTSTGFTGSLADAVVYTSVLTTQQIANHAKGL